MFSGLVDRPGRWEWIQGALSARRTGIKIEAAREYADTHGIVWDGDLLDRIEVCEAWQLKEDARREALRHPDDDEQAEAVN